MINNQNVRGVISSLKAEVLADSWSEALHKRKTMRSRKLWPNSQSDTKHLSFTGLCQDKNLSAEIVALEISVVLTLALHAALSELEKRCSPCSGQKY